MKEMMYSPEGIPSARRWAYAGPGEGSQESLHKRAMAINMQIKDLKIWICLRNVTPCGTGDSIKAAKRRLKKRSKRILPLR
jgi:hypothetical protein